MKILLIAPLNKNLYKMIKDELIEEGHTVSYFPEIEYPGNPYYKHPNLIKRWIKRFWFEKMKLDEKYWRIKLKDQIFNQYYDLLFVIQGTTFHVLLKEHLLKFNQTLKTVLYIWDSNSLYDYFRNVKYFDKVYSFDFKDVRSLGNGRVKFLPFFWPKQLLYYDNVENKYEISSIGSNHHGRFEIYKKVIDDAKCNNHSYYIRLITKIPYKLTLKQKLGMLVALLFNDSSKKDYYKFLQGSNKYDFVESDFYDINAVSYITAESKAILDTDNPNQYGTTPRLIWALAQNKHVFTTNQHIKQLPFYNDKFIHIINRNNPVIDYSLLKIDINSRDSVNYLRIDNWLKNFIE